MTYILHIETSSKYCSVAISHNEKIVALAESKEEFDHSSVLGLNIQKAIHRAEISFSDLSAVSVSRGPGSYTGLRIGTSTAKGICYALDIPLISADTLKALASAALLQEDYSEDDLLVPVIDTRRMEVYASIFNRHLHNKKEPYALIVEENSFRQYLNDGYKIHLIGEAAKKCEKMLFNSAVFFNDHTPIHVKNLVSLGYNKWLNSDFEDFIYYEPFYLKSVTITVSNKLYF